MANEGDTSKAWNYRSSLTNTFVWMISEKNDICLTGQITRWCNSPSSKASLVCIWRNDLPSCTERRRLKKQNILLTRTHIHLRLTDRQPPSGFAHCAWCGHYGQTDRQTEREGGEKEQCSARRSIQWRNEWLVIQSLVRHWQNFVWSSNWTNRRASGVRRRRRRRKKQETY